MNMLVRLSKRLDRIVEQGSITKTQNNIRFFYIYLLTVTATSFSELQKFQQYQDIQPLWPVLWIPWIGIAPSFFIIFSFFLITALLVALFPSNRLFRILVFIGIFEYLASIYSFSKINHSSHLLILISFILIFLPSGWNKITDNKSLISKNTLFIFLGVQGITLTTYTMSGFWKIKFFFEQFLNGEVHAFMPQALALLIADYSLKMNLQTILGGWFIDHYYLSWPLYIGTIYLEFFAIYILFKPSIQKFWAISLILFHIFSYLTMEILFLHNIIILALLFINSPFHQKDDKYFFKDLPIIGWVIKKFLNWFKIALH